MCNRCILPANYPGILFDEEGICNYCLNYETQTYLGESEFKRILSSINGKGGCYDCLVPLSGGRDSTFVLYQMKNRFKMNILAYNYDNGFVSSIAKQNIKRTAEKLQVEVVKLKSKRDIQCKNLRHLIKLGLNKSPENVLFNLCSGCGNGIWGGAYKIAKGERIPLVIFGESEIESGTAKTIISEGLVRTWKDKIRDAIKMPGNFLFRKYYSILLEKEFPLHDFTDIRKVNYYDYIKWDKNSILSVIQNELGWQSEAGNSSWRFDCKIHVLVEYMYKKLYGFTEKNERYSRMIREGMLTREDALSKINSYTGENEKEMEVINQLFDRLKLKNKERYSILNPKMDSVQYKGSSHYVIKTTASENVSS